MKEQPKPSKLKRATLFLLKVYATLCTLIVTAFIGLIVWAKLTPDASATQQEGTSSRGVTTTKDDLPGWRLNVDTELRLDGSYPDPSRFQLDGAANRDQPIRSETNRTSAAAGPGR